MSFIQRKKVMLTDEQYNTLLTTGTITVEVEGTPITLTYDPNTEYDTPLPDAPVKGALLGGAQATVDTNGNIVVPAGSSTRFGLFKTNAGAGINQDNGVLFIEYATNDNIANRTTRRPITPLNANAFAIAVLTDENHITLTTEQQATARSVFGAGTQAQTVIWSDDEV